MQVLYVRNFTRHLSTFSFNLTGPGRHAPPPLLFPYDLPRNLSKGNKASKRGEANLFRAEESHSQEGSVAYTVLLTMDSCHKECGKETPHFRAIVSQPFSSRQGEKGSELQEYINQMGKIEKDLWHFREDLTQRFHFCHKKLIHLAINPLKEIKHIDTAQVMCSPCGEMPVSCGGTGLA